MPLFSQFYKLLESLEPSADENICLLYSMNACILNDLAYYYYLYFKHFLSTCIVSMKALMLVLVNNLSKCYALPKLL